MFVDGQPLVEPVYTPHEERVRAAIHRIEIPFPRSAEFAPGTFDMQQIGDTVLARAAGGTRVTTDELLEALAKGGVLDQRMEDTVRSVGFESGYYLPHDVELGSEPMEELQAQWGANLAKPMLEVKGWDTVDVLAVASDTAHNDIAERTAAELACRGVSVHTTEFYSQACHGGIGAINDLLQREEYQGARALVLPIEALVGDGKRGMNDTANPVTWRTFGVGIAGFAGVIGEDLEFVTGKTVVRYDTEMALTATPPINVPEEAQRDYARFPWYELEGDLTRAHFAPTTDGVILEIPSRGDGRFTMNGKLVMDQFSKEVPPLVLGVTQAYAALGKPYGVLGETISHQASEAVTTALNRRMMQQALMELLEIDERVAYRLAKNPQQLAKTLEERGKQDFQVPQLTWQMGKGVGINNVSPATTIVAAVEMARKGMLHGDQANLVVCMGVGRIISANVWHFA